MGQVTNLLPFMFGPLYCFILNFFVSPTDFKFSGLVGFGFSKERVLWLVGHGLRLRMALI